MRIKEIAYSGVNGDRCTIIFEDETVLKSFTSAALSAGIYPGMELTQEQYFEIISGIQKIASFCQKSYLSVDNLVLGIRAKRQTH